MMKVLFVCTHNSARSQIAEAFLRSKYGDFFQAFSAGTNPTKLNPFTKEIMAEIGIDISNHESKHVKSVLNNKFDIVVTVCDSAKQSCPFIPGAKHYIHKSFPDPSKVSGSKKTIFKKLRLIRNEIENWIDEEFNQYIS